MLQIERQRVDDLELYVRTDPLVHHTWDVSIAREVQRVYFWDKLEGAQIEDAIDVGAHIGAWTLALKQRYPNARVTAVEPEANNAVLLRLNCSGYGNVLIEQAACVASLNLHSDDDWRVLWIDNERTGSHKMVPRRTCPGPFQFAPRMTTLDEMSTLFHGDIDLLKIDCEGCEQNVLANTPDWVLARIRRIVGEYHSDEARFLATIAARLEAAGFTVEHRHRPPHDLGYFYAERKL